MSASPLPLTPAAPLPQAAPTSDAPLSLGDVILERIRIANAVVNHGVPDDEPLIPDGAFAHPLS